MALTKKSETKSAKKATSKNPSPKKKTEKKGSSRPKSKSGKFGAIKELVYTLLEKDKEISYEKMETAVMKEFPTSAFKKSHYSWYKSQFNSAK